MAKRIKEKKEKKENLTLSLSPFTLLALSKGFAQSSQRSRVSGEFMAKRI